MSQLRSPVRYSTQNVSAATDKNWALKATYVEIYNEQLRDLLIPENVPQHERGAVTIREDVKGNILLTGLRQVEINSVDDLMNALNFGSTIRQTDATAINAKSSRSHAVFSLNLVQRKNRLQSAQGVEKRFSVPIEAMTGAESWVTTDSKLHFVDLAGSERLKNTGAQGERAKEGISINAGLAALGKVISQLSSRQAGSHVSYRDSKLTRLLQDSLGGNAITYMIACVTPAEFHLSETLNTVQYAQRARAIQSKPRIQQVEEGDKQAIIDRLKAEVAFLREQIRSAERGGGERRTLAANERSERHNEREVELQNQLLDSQENYTTLSQRHAKLIAEMAKARDNEQAENMQLEETLGDSATERLNRSNSFAQAVEQVVLEYEKTIQSLEQSLSSTRGTLSTTETNLLEKETKCAYVETINTQLQARLQKLMDREASTENYLHDLESKLDGHTSGEEKNATIILELRKEIARVRENEASCEDYISTLEERLAEADQDAELMQREIDRLEQVIERQRSLGKLDSLLYELDHIQNDGKQPETEQDTTAASNGHGIQRRHVGDHSRSQSHVSISRHSRKDVIPEDEEETKQDDGTPRATQKSAVAAATGAATPVSASAFDEADTKAEDRSLEPSTHSYPPQSPAQSQFVADKLENVTQELIDLRVEHETTLNEYEMLHQKYEEALRTLADFQDAMDEARHPNRTRDSLLSVTSPTQTRPPSFLSDARSSDLKDGGRYSSSRSLSSELSSAMESPATIDTSDAETATARQGSNGVSTEDLVGHDQLTTELHRLKSLAAEKEAAEKDLADKYAQLEQTHHDTLDMLEELKTEVSKAKAAETTTPHPNTPIIRRKSSQNVMIIDRAHRSFASLRNIAAEHFEDDPDVMQNFELNLNSAMHELHARSERIQELEADVASAKKEMETKMTIISGLTRERSSLKSSPMDISVVSTLKDQLEQKDRLMKGLRDNHEAREKELAEQIASLQAVARTAPAIEGIATRAVVPQSAEADDTKVAELKAELANWEGKHKTALDSFGTTEKQMRKTIESLESELSVANAKITDASRSLPDSEKTGELEEKHKKLVDFLRSEIDEYKALINSNAGKVAELEQAHTATKTELESALKARELATTETKTHKDLVSNLEQQISAHEDALKTHQNGLKSMQTKYAKELEQMKVSEQKGYEEQVAVLMTEHAENVRVLESDLTEAREELLKVATQVAFAMGLDVSVEKISERIEDLIADQKALGQEQKKSGELEKHVGDLSAINDTVLRDLEAVKATLAELLIPEDGQLKSPLPVPEQLAALKKKIADLTVRNKKNSRLVEELEDQLQSNYDQAQITNNRLSTLQTERNAALEEANSARSRVQAELEAVRDEYAALQVCC
jgi:chromosome segregation ATPase